MFLPARRSLGCSWVRLLLLAVALQGLVAVAVAAEPVSEQTLAERRKEIASRSEAQRQDLVRKYEQYKNLSAEERQKLQDLHQVMETDPKLKQVMNQYCEWVGNLDLTQREQLRQAKTPEQKRHLVERFRTQQKKRKDDDWREPDQRPKDKWMPITLSSEDLKAVMSQFETALSKDEELGQRIQKRLSNTEGSQRYKLLMRVIGEYRKSSNGQNHEFKIPDAVFSELEKVSQKPNFRETLEGLARNSNGHQPQNFIFYILAKNTVDEAHREFRGPHAANLKESLFNSLAPEMQTRYTEAPPPQRDALLVRFHQGEIVNAFAAAGDLPKWTPGERGPGGRDLPQPFRNGEPRGNRGLRPDADRESDIPPAGRRRKTE